MSKCRGVSRRVEERWGELRRVEEQYVTIKLRYSEQFTAVAVGELSDVIDGEDIDKQHSGLFPWCTSTHDWDESQNKNSSKEEVGFFIFLDKSQFSDDIANHSDNLFI